MRRKVVAVWCAVAAVGLCAQRAAAVDSQEWELSTVEHFLAGEFDGVVLESPGTLQAGLARQEISIDAGHVWAVVQTRDGVLYAGTGNEGRVYVIAPDGSETHMIELEGSQVYALVIGKNDTVYAATSPNGAIFRLSADGTAEEWYRPEATYVWAMLRDTGGAFYAATGDPARILHITGQQQATVVYESDATHLLALAWRTDGTLLAGTGDTGILLAVPPGGGGTAEVVYDAPLEEVRSILPTADGGAYFVAVQSQPGKAAPAAALKLSGLTGESAKSKNSAKNGVSTTPKPSRRSGAAASVLYHVDAAGRVEPLWTGKGQRVHAAAMLGDDVLLATDQKGTLLRVTPDGIPAVVYRGRQDTLVAAAVTADGTVLLGTAEAASVVRLGPGAPALATYTSAVQDAGTLARFGHVRWAVGGDGRGPALRVRTGNTREPDDRWTEWSAPTRDVAGAQTLADSARFFQFRFEWGKRDRHTGVTRVNVPFAAQNLPPRVVKVEFEMKGRLDSAAVNAGAEADSTALQALLKRYTNGKEAKKAEETPTHSSAIKVTWKALDPNEDTLEYTLEFRGLGESLWKELETELDKAEYAWETSLVPDGWYEVRVEVTDRPSNAETDAATADAVSEPVLVDNTGPVVENLHATSAGNARARVQGRVTDTLLPLRRGRYALDGQAWVWFAPQDGLFDSTNESFTLEFENLEPGEHTVAIQVLDAARNIGSAKRVFMVK